ncbi:hypothetical protein GX408_02405 [bacterium]|nr:hypothetical protein [bacterium]
MGRKFSFLRLLILACLPLHADQPPADFPQFVVPGFEQEMTALRNLFWLHYEPAGPLSPLWDEWMTLSTLWPACTPDSALATMRERWRTALMNRIINSEGYVHTQQHDGPAHAEGWPFPRWMEAGGIGWHFRGTGVPGYEAPLATPEGWTLEQAKVDSVNDKGWLIHLTGPHARLQPPSFSIDAESAPWLRLNWWASGLTDANPYVEWTTVEQPDFSPERRAYFSPAESEGQLLSSPPMGPQSTRQFKAQVVETRTMIPVHRVPGWKGTLTSLRICFGNSRTGQVVIKSFHTACDTRHTVNNTAFLRGCISYFLWTRDLVFLRQQIGRMRTALRFMMNEFQTRSKNCVYTTWPGHEGRSGVTWDKTGAKVIRRNQGIGSNYWDLLPFGGEDALATIYYYDAVLDLAGLEEQILRHPQWCVPGGAEAFDPSDLRDHARRVKQYGGRRFWNEKTGRFGTVDLDGVLHDYGFTFLNNEAIYYDFTSPQQAESIRSWISGRRSVAGDTSSGADIYHWRFGPRSTTRRNIDYYYWAWSNPERIPWGFQVQDGGAVLGFSYHDLMARLLTEGPDDAWRRLKEIIRWFEETQAAGGYRAFYKDPKNGTMQGSNVAGGLGLDKEFFESILVPQVMLYGFLGFQPTADGCAIDPRLPKEWPALTITGIRLHGCVVDITAHEKSITIKGVSAPGEKLIVDLPSGLRLAPNSAPFVCAQ